MVRVKNGLHCTKKEMLFLTTVYVAKLLPFKQIL